MPDNCAGGGGASLPGAGKSYSKPGFLLTARSKNPLLKEVIRDAMAGVYQVSPSCFHLLKLQRLAVALRVRGSSGSDPSAGTRGAVARPVMAHAARWGAK